jgi:hypothetical protein
MTRVLVRHMRMKNGRAYRRTPGPDMRTRARAPATIADLMTFFMRAPGRIILGHYNTQIVSGMTIHGSHRKPPLQLFIYLPARVLLAVLL